jgi:hypothetical protein
MVVTAGPQSSDSPRWPRSDSLYALDNWTAGPEQLGSAINNTQQITRSFRAASGQLATLTIFTQHQAPKLYGAGAEVPFLGNGYTIVNTPEPLADLRRGELGSLVAERGSERWLVFYAYGEHRGLLGNGVLPWGLALLDQLAGAPNDYYKLYLATRSDGSSPILDRQTGELAQTLFQRISGWYARLT